MRSSSLEREEAEMRTRRRRRRRKKAAPRLNLETLTWQVRKC